MIRIYDIVSDECQEVKTKGNYVQNHTSRAKVV